jgi:hypothetical protein
MKLKSFFATPSKVRHALVPGGAHKKLVRLTATLMYDNLSKRQQASPRRFKLQAIRQAFYAARPRFQQAHQALRVPFV